jgi:hypothetical protein
MHSDPADSGTDNSFRYYQRLGGKIPDPSNTYCSGSTGFFPVKRIWATAPHFINPYNSSFSTFLTKKG